MRPPSLRDWTGEDGTGQVTTDATPAAEVQLLIAADQAVNDVATTPYCGVGHMFQGGTTGLETRHWAAVIAPAGRHCRLYVGAGLDTIATGSQPWTWTTATAGSAAPDVVTTAMPWYGTRAYPGNLQVGIVTGAGIDDHPISTCDHQGVLTAQRSPYAEAMQTDYACAVSMVVSEQAGALEVLPP